MSPSRYLFSALISLLLLAGCSHTRNITISDVDKNAIHSPVMPGIKKVTFKATITAKRQEYSGVMVIKKMPDGEYRIAYFNEVGMSYLEGTLKGEAYPWKLSCNLVSPFLSSVKVLRDLETALNLLLVPGDPASVKAEPGYVFGESDDPAKIFFYLGKKNIFLTLEKI